MIYLVYVLICLLGFVIGIGAGHHVGLRMAIDMMIAAGIAEMEEEEDDKENTDL